MSHCIEDVSEGTHSPENAFVIGWPTTNFVASFPDSQTKDLWQRKLQETVIAEKAKEHPQSIPMKVITKDSSNQTKSKSLSVLNTEDARGVVKRCVQDFGMKGDDNSYQLWVLSDGDATPYPLIGHETPHSIRMNQLRDSSKASSTLDLDALAQEDSAVSNYQFILREKRKADSSAKSSFGGEVLKKRDKSKQNRSPFHFFKRKSVHEQSISSSPQGKLFARPVSELVVDGKLQKPLMDLLAYLYIHGPSTPGIFRKAPNQKNVKELRERLDNGESFNPDESNPITVASTLKEFLRSLPDCLLMSELFPMWVETASAETYDTQIHLMRHVCERLPYPHRVLLQHLLCILHSISNAHECTHMDAYNLAVCTSQSLLWAAGGDTNASPSSGLPDGLPAMSKEHVQAMEKVPLVVQAFVQHTTEIFGKEALHLFDKISEAPEAISPPVKVDVSTDSDSVHSVHSVPEARHDPARQDNSSIDSLDRDPSSENELSSPGLLKNYGTNLSHDSGLFSSDNQLYEDSLGGSDGAQGSNMLRAVSCESDSRRAKLNMSRLSASYEGSRSNAESLLRHDTVSSRRKYLTVTSGESSDSQLASSLSRDSDSEFSSRATSQDAPSVFDEQESSGLDGSSETLHKSASGARIFIDDSLLCDRTPKPGMTNIPEEEHHLAVKSSSKREMHLAPSASLEDSELEIKDISAASSTCTLVESSQTTPRSKSPSQAQARRAPRLKDVKPRSLDLDILDMELVSIPMSHVPRVMDSVALRGHKGAQFRSCDFISAKDVPAQNLFPTSQPSLLKSESVDKQADYLPHSSRLVKKMQSSSLDRSVTDPSLPHTASMYRSNSQTPAMLSSYNEAMIRKKLSARGINPSRIPQSETEQQRRRSEKALQLYNASLQQYSQESTSKDNEYFSEPEVVKQSRLETKPSKGLALRQSVPLMGLRRREMSGGVPAQDQLRGREGAPAKSTSYDSDLTSRLKTVPPKEGNGGGKARNKSRERLSDTHLDNRKRKKKYSNLARSKSDTSERLRRRNDSTDSDEEREETQLPRFRRYGRSTANKGESSKVDEPQRVPRERQERPKSIDPAALLKQLQEAGYVNEQGETMMTAKERRKSWTVKNRAWHKELSEQYSEDNLTLLQPQPAKYTYRQPEAPKSPDEQPAKVWVRPIHPSKDLVVLGSSSAEDISQVKTRAYRKTGSVHTIPVQKVEPTQKPSVQCQQQPKESFNPKTLPEPKASSGEPAQRKKVTDDKAKTKQSRLGWSVTKLRQKYDKGMFYTPDSEKSLEKSSNSEGEYL